ncbi:fimbrial protein [Porphyromonas bennonis]|uniref:fimbrial protein n=1 Tax=Porphyromonas bennonis TaxID=501496 RepID=UPI00138B1A19|nr:fimbrial protein [Porphyromonas bennonis]
MIQTRNLSHTLLLSLLALLSLTLTGCRQDRLWGDEVDPEGGDQTIELSILLPDNSGSLRSTEGGDTKAETLVGTLDIYLYKGDNLSTTDTKTITPEYHEHITVNSSAGVIHRAISHKEQRATYQIYVVANAPAKLLTGKETLSELTASVTNSIPSLVGPYVMSGRSRDFKPSEAKHVDVVLSRIASKVVVTDGTKPDNKFELISVIPLRPDRSYLFSHTTPFEVGDQKKVDNPIVPKKTEILQGDKVSASGGKVTLLTYESGLPKEVFKGVGAGLLIHAKYEGEEYWYRFALMDGRGRQIVRRNSVYSVEIKEVNGKGYDTPEEALKHRPINMILGITSTETAIKLSEQIVTDGEYFIGSTRAIIHLGSRANKEYEIGGVKYATNRNDRQVAPVITIRSNIPDFSEFKIQDETYSYAVDGISHKGLNVDDPDGESWITAELKAHTKVPGEIEIPATQDLAYDFRGLYIDDRWGGVTEEQLIEKRYTRSVEYKIGVDSHPNLFLRLTIDQTPDELLRDQLVIYPSLLSVDSKRQQTFDLFIQGYHEGFEWEVMGVTYLIGEDPKSQKWVSYSPAKGITGVDKHILVTTDPLSKHQNSGHALVKVKLTNPKGEVVDIKTIRISSGEALEYDIVYPEGSPRVKDLSRTIRVIETPLDQSGDLTYTINVRSVTPWIVQRPEKDSDWITQPVLSIDPNTATAGVGFNGKFTVTVKQNKVEPLNGLYKARQSVVRIISERASRDIIVYQGGYVVIGDTKWIDRNLMRTARKDMVIRDYQNYYALPDGYNGMSIENLLYPAAVPIAFGENTFACYAKHRVATTPLIYAATSANPPFVYHDNTAFYYYVSKGGKPSPQRDGYFGGCMPATLMAQSYFTDANSALENAWNASANMDNFKERDPLKEPTSKGAYDPCPKGWRTAGYREVNELVQYMARDPHFYSGGREDSFINSDDPDAVRKVGEDYKAPYNNGVYFINEDNVNVWFPYAGYRQASNDVADVDGSAFTQLMKPGYEGRYWFNFFYGDGNSIFLSIKTTADGSLKAALMPDNAFFGASVRCVENKPLN